jgi:hypothetical protein
MLGRKFHAPRTSQIAQWKKVSALVNYGFRFESVYRDLPSGERVSVPYPERLSGVPAFVAEFKSQALGSVLGPHVAGRIK